MRVGGRYPFSSLRQRGNSLTSWWTQHNYQRPKGLWNITSVDNRSASVGFQLNRSLAFEKQEIKTNRESSHWLRRWRKDDWQPKDAAERWILEKHEHRCWCERGFPRVLHSHNRLTDSSQWYTMEKAKELKRRLSNFWEEMLQTSAGVRKPQKHS